MTASSVASSNGPAAGAYSATPRPSHAAALAIPDADFHHGPLAASHRRQLSWPGRQGLFRTAGGFRLPRSRYAPVVPRTKTPGRRLAHRDVFRGRVVEVSVDRVRMPDGREVEMELVRHPGSAGVLPIAEAPDGGEEVLLLRQYRYATGGWLLEIPAGKLDPGESAEDCARRELVEETGWAAGEIEPLGKVWPSPGILAERIALFVARGLTPAEQRLEDDELLTVERLPLSEAIARAAAGEIDDAKTVCALLRLAVRGGLAVRRGSRAGTSPARDP